MKPTLSRQLILTAVLSMGLFAARFPALAAAKESAPCKPNILYIMSDDHAIEAIGAYGSWLKDYVKTPNIDRLAKEGMLLTNVCCNSALCSPSRASIMTGQYGHTNHIMDFQGNLNPESPWLSKELKKGGYQTYLVGKYHLYHNAPQGFDDFRIVNKQGQWFDPMFYGPNGFKKVIKGYSSDVYTDLALDVLEKRDKNKPFCMMLQFKAPHYSYECPKRLVDLYKDVAEFPEPATLYDDVKETSPRVKHIPFPIAYYYHRQKADPVFQMKKPSGQNGATKVSYQHMIRKYLTCVAAVDENIGRMLKYLGKEGIADDTIIIYTSDQGYFLGQHGRYDKRTILDPSLKMPFVVRYPSVIKPGSRNDDLCSNVDFAPTLLNMAGLPVPKSMQGRSMLPLFKGTTPEDWRDAVWFNYAHGASNYGIKTKDYTLVHFEGAKFCKLFEFYDNKEDPEQRTSQHDNPQYKPLIDRAEKKMREVLDEIGLSLPSYETGLRMKDGSKIPKSVVKFNYDPATGERVPEEEKK